MARLLIARLRAGRLRLLYHLRDPWDAAGRAIVCDAEAFSWDRCDTPGSIFKTTGDMGIPYCHARVDAVRTSYSDGSCLYPSPGDVVATFTDGHREIV